MQFAAGCPVALNANGLLQVSRWVAAEADLPFAAPSSGLLLDLNDPAMTFEVVRAADHKVDNAVLNASAATVLPAPPLKVWLA